MSHEPSQATNVLERDIEQIEEMRHHVKIYIGVFVALAVLTVVTVGVAYIHFPGPLAIAVAMLIAGIKGSLVACYFMHLIDERKLIYWVLLLTAFFFIVMMGLPMGQSIDSGANELIHREEP